MRLSSWPGTEADGTVHDADHLNLDAGDADVLADGVLLSEQSAVDIVADDGDGQAVLVFVVGEEAAGSQIDLAAVRVVGVGARDLRIRGVVALVARLRDSHVAAGADRR